MSASNASLIPAEKTDRLKRWSDRWDNNRTGWHKAEVNPVLLKYGQHIIPNFEPTDDNLSTCPNPVRVLVPLCGKTVDLRFLAEHGSIGEVVGVEGIRKALEEFAEEHPSLEVKPVSEDEDSAAFVKFDRFEGNSISLLKGDFFELNDSETGGKFDALWDRASLVAIDPSLRKEYVDVIGKLMKPGGTILLSTLDRRAGTEEGKADGPPFSVPEAGVEELYKSNPWVDSIELMEESDAFIDEGTKVRLSDQGVTSLFELVFVIKTKAEA